MTLLLITVALVSALVTMRLALHAREVAVPELHGRTPAEARRLAEGHGLSAQEDRQYYSATVPEGRIISQTPAAGSVVRRGWNVRFTVSLGPQRVTIPQVIGASQRAAAITLQQRGLDVSVSEVNVPGTTPGQVLAQDPPADATDVAAPKVKLLVAADSAPNAYIMPSFTGRPLGSVALAIKDAGFNLGKVSIADPSAQPPLDAALNPGQPPTPAPSASPAPRSPNGTVPSPAAIVVLQQPAAGQRVVAGTEVRLTVR